MISVLLITNKGDVTTDFVVKCLREEKINFYRFNTEDLLSKIFLSFNFSANEFKLIDQNLNIEVDLLKIKSVYYRRPLSPKFKDENLNYGEKKFVNNEIVYSLEGLYKILKNAFWISSVFAIREAESKVHQLQVAKEIGFKIPDSLITNNSKIAASFIKNNKTVIKPIKSGLIEDSRSQQVIFTSLITDTQEIERIKFCPTYFQRFINKTADVRVTVVGDEIFAALINSQEYDETKVDWRSSENLKLKYERIVLPSNLKYMCLELTKKLNLNFGAIDFVIDQNGDFFFLEINPNGQWAWIERQLDYKISFEIVKLLKV